MITVVSRTATSMTWRVPSFRQDLARDLRGALLVGGVRVGVQEADGHGPSELTAREREVLTLVAEGNSNQEIADLLRLSRKTVEVHRRNLMLKLGIHRAADLVKHAIREGLVVLDPT